MALAVSACKDDVKSTVKRSTDPEKVPTMSSRNVQTVISDSAYYDEQARLWSLNGNVRITNVNKDLILTDQMYWNQGEHRLYSDAFIHIEKIDRVIEGYGYDSNEKLTTYQIHKVKAIFPVDQTKMRAGM